MGPKSCRSAVRRAAIGLPLDVLRVVSLGLQSRTHRTAENLFLRKQLALYQERRAKALANAIWGVERIAAELHPKLGIHVSPRTVRQAVLAWDFFVAVTASFRMPSVFIVLEVGTSGAPHGS